MSAKADITSALATALPIMLGYAAIGVPCGILGASIGLSALQAFLFSLLFYSGAGQFMLSNMWLAGSPLPSIVASIALVNTRQMLYSASLAPSCRGASTPAAFLFAATVTDESFGVNSAKFKEGGWSVRRGMLVNLFSQTSWSISNAAGVLLGDAIDMPLAIASFAMTSIFICLLVTQRLSLENAVAATAAMAGVVACKALGLSGAAVLVGALFGVACAMAASRIRRRA